MPLQDKEKSPVLGFITWNPNNAVSVEKAQLAAAKALDECQLVSRADQYTREFQNILPNISIRDGYSRNDYEYFRRNERVPQKQKEIIRYCMEAARKIGLVRNVVDLMSDFATQGMELVHPNKQIQKFYRGWWETVKGKDRSERIASLLVRAGNVVAKRVVAKISEKNEKFLRSLASEDLESFPELPKIDRRTIPIRYDFINPLSVEKSGGELSQFIGKSIYAIKVPLSVKNKVLTPSNELEKELVKFIPDYLYKEIKSGNEYFVPDQNKLKVCHYKKDDWQDWADPMIYAIYDDLLMLEKMKLADLAALDGAISQIRIWKLGDLERGLFPTDKAISKLVEILMSNPGGGAFDLIWGPDLTVEEYKTNVHQFLGGSKYEPVLNNIYAGLGIPPTLTGSANAGGFTNNYISLKTLIKRLEYIRDIILDFWKMEIELIRQSMGFRFGAEIKFDRMVLSDEAAEKKLLMDMADRLHISTETLRERFGESDELETLRLRREARERESGTRTPIGGPYLSAEKQFDLAKIALQRTLITPNEAGLDVPEKYKKAPFLQQLDIQKNKVKDSPISDENKGVSGQGRPKNSKDTEKRKQKDVKIRTSASDIDINIDNISKFMVHMTWAKEAQQIISDIITPSFLEQFGKKNLRSLSNEEFSIVENIKFMILANTQPLSEIGVSQIKDVVDNPNSIIPPIYSKLYDTMIKVTKKEKGSELTVDETRNLQASIYAILNSIE
jgi:hypothetical protein